MRFQTAVGVAALTLAFAAPARAQKPNHVAELNKSDKAVAMHAHELSEIAKPGLTKAKASPHAEAILKNLDAADMHLGAAEKGLSGQKDKLAISEIRKDHEAARMHFKEMQAELDKPKVDAAAVKKHVGALDSAIDDATGEEAKLPGAPKNAKSQ